MHTSAERILAEHEYFMKVITIYMVSSKPQGQRGVLQLLLGMPSWHLLPMQLEV